MPDADRTLAAVLDNLKNRVCEASREMARAGLVRLTWGSVSAIDREMKLVVVTPVNVGDGELRPQDQVIVDFAGRVVQGNQQPSPDVPAHLALYRRFAPIGGIAHCHSVFATIFAQARRGIEPLGAMHTDFFAGAIPITRDPRTGGQVQAEAAGIGEVLAKCLDDSDVFAVPGALVPGDGPFAWGRTAWEAVRYAKALEAVAETALGTFLLGGGGAPAVSPR